MSYILDALKRAESDREREAAGVPGVHAHAMDFDDEGAHKPRSSWALTTGLGAGVLVGILGLGWYLWPREVVPAGVQTAVQRPSPPTPLPQVAEASRAGLPASPLPGLAANGPLPTPSPTATSPINEPAQPKPKPKPKPKLEEPSAPSTPSAPPQRIYRISELPDTVRQELPSLSLGGSMYSDKPASRMVIVNGQVFHEGDTLAPNVVLEHIKAKEAVLSFKGYRYSVAY
jgi:general secretion pathway protein B